MSEENKLNGTDQVSIVELKNFLVEEKITINQFNIALLNCYGLEETLKIITKELRAALDALNTINMISKSHVEN